MYQCIFPHLIQTSASNLSVAELCIFKNILRGFPSKFKQLLNIEWAMAATKLSIFNKQQLAEKTGQLLHDIFRRQSVKGGHVWPRDRYVIGLWKMARERKKKNSQSVWTDGPDVKINPLKGLASHVNLVMMKSKTASQPKTSWTSFFYFAVLKKVKWSNLSKWGENDPSLYICTSSCSFLPLCVCAKCFSLREPLCVNSEITG